MKQSTDPTVQFQTAVMIVGAPGSRKSSLALQFPKPYWFDADSNLKGVRDQYPDKPFFYDSAYIDDDGKEVLPFDRYKHMVKCLNAAAKSDDIRTIVLDSMTTIATILFDEIRRQNKMAADTPMRIQDYGAFLTLLNNLITKLRNCGKVLVVISHEKVDKDELTQRQLLLPAIPGQSAHTLAGLFTDVLAPFCTSSPTAAPRWSVRVMPLSETDKRGVKSSMNFTQAVVPWEDMVKAIASKIQ